MKYIVFTPTGHPVGVFSKTVAEQKCRVNPELNRVRTTNAASDMRMLLAASRAKGSIKSIAVTFVNEDGKIEEMIVDQNNVHLLKSGLSDENPYKTDQLTKKQKTDLKIKFGKKDFGSLEKLFDSLDIHRVCTSCDDREDQIRQIVEDMINNKWI